MVHFAERIRPIHLPNVAPYWKSSNTEACAKKLSQILADTWGVGLVSEFMWGSSVSKNHVFVKLTLFFALKKIIENKNKNNTIYWKYDQDKDNIGQVIFLEFANIGS